ATVLLNASGPLLQAGGTLNLNLGGFVTVTGNAAVRSGSTLSGVSLSPGTLAPTMLTIGGSSLNVFAGVNGAGVQLTGVSFGLALVQDTLANSYWGLQATATTTGLVGLPASWTVSMTNVTVKVNASDNG